MQLDILSTQNRNIIDFRKYGFTDLQVLGKYNYNKSETKLPNHSHEGMIEICYYDKGSQYFEVNNKQYLIKGGEVFIHFPNEIHGSGGHPEEKGLLYWIIIKTEGGEENTLSFLCNYLIEKQKRHFKGGKEIKKYLEEIFLVHSKEEPVLIKKARIYLMAQTFMLKLIDAMESERHDTDNERLHKVLTYIDKNILDKISISALANEINLSESRFKNLFKELTGFTPGDYMQRKKIEIALEKIKSDPNISLTNLAYELNFSSPQYFSTVIKKYIGTTPSSIKSNP
ncbi:AraC family transcriptional regulator [Pedobacter nyackensis]|uniref:AraC family transcriptional regulator n=1 Tax=Pedobacter nyackensis TaxID=475255 RepID=UPI0029318880|nr:AraC family transcriptional regulator [Pedobacter nyackensis]